MASELSIIIPTFNDKQGLYDLVAGWTSFLAKEGINFQICIYDDGSTNPDSHIIHKRIESDFKNVKITKKNNEGHGPTVLRGYEDHLNSSWIFQMDSDDEIGPEKFLALWHKRSEFDFLYVERIYKKRSLVRKLTTLISKVLVRVLYGGKITDNNTPFRLMSSNFLKVALPAIPHDTFAPNILIMGQAIFYDIPRFSISLELNDFGTPSTLGISRLLKGSITTVLEIIEHRLKLHLS